MTTLVELSKAVRPYDPEDKRQRNSGILPGVAAGGAIATGAQTARQFERTDLRTMGRRLKNMEAPVRVKNQNRLVPAHGPGDYVTIQSPKGKAKRYRPNAQNQLYRVESPRTSGGKYLSAKRAGRAKAGKWGAATVGLAGLAAYGAHRAGSRKNRRWK